MTDPRPSLFEVAAALARAEAESLPRVDTVIARADRVRFVSQLRHAFRFPDDADDRAPISSESARVRDCLNAGVDPYGEL
jgi:hypothetical protein